MGNEGVRPGDGGPASPLLLPHPGHHHLRRPAPADRHASVAPSACPAAWQRPRRGKSTLTGPYWLLLLDTARQRYNSEKLPRTQDADTKNECLSPSSVVTGTVLRCTQTQARPPGERPSTRRSERCLSPGTASPSLAGTGRASGMSKGLPPNQHLQIYTGTHLFMQYLHRISTPLEAVPAGGTSLSPQTGSQTSPSDRGAAVGRRRSMKHEELL